MYTIPPIIMQVENEKMIVSIGAIFHFYDSSFPVTPRLCFGFRSSCGSLDEKVEVGYGKQELYGEMVVSYDIELAMIFYDCSKQTSCAFAF